MYKQQDDLSEYFVVESYFPNKEIAFRPYLESTSYKKKNLMQNLSGLIDLYWMNGQRGLYDMSFVNCQITI